MEGTAVAIDYDFRLARAHFRGSGWRGLAALALVLIVRATSVAVVAFFASSGGMWLVQLLKRLV
jgi:hypothetical protein